jgi:hypothetical protein
VPLLAIVQIPAPDRPNWLAAGQEVAVTLPAKPATHTIYAEWFAWARRNIQDGNRAHASAQAATTAIEAGGHPDAVAQLAQMAAEAPDAASAPIRADQHTQRYAGWYAWATLEHNLDSQTSHRAAALASQAQMQGAEPAQAAVMALQAVGAPAPVLPGVKVPLTKDPGFHSAVVGAISVGILFVGFFFFILPVIGVFYALRALYVGVTRHQSRIWLAVVGLVLNLIGCGYVVLELLVRAHVLR